LEEGREGALGCFGFVAIEGLGGGVEAFEQGGGHGGTDDVVCHVAVEEEDGEKTSRKH